MTEDDHTVLGRALLVVEACLGATGATTLAQLTSLTGLPKPTVRRLANALVARAALERSDEGYRPGPALVEWGAQAAQRRAREAAIVPHLHELQARTGSAVWLVSTADPSHWPILGSLYDHRAAASGYADIWPHDPRQPTILATALGVLGLSTRRDHAERLLDHGVPRATPRTQVDRRRIDLALDRAAAEGEVVEQEGLYVGWSCLAVPVTDEQGGVQAVLGVVDRTPRFRADRFLAQAHAAATRLGPF